MSNIRLAPLAVAIIAAALAPAVWAAESGDAGKDQTASQSTLAKDRGTSVPAQQADSKQGNGNGAESGAAPREPVAKAPQRRSVVTASDIQDMNQRYPGG